MDKILEKVWNLLGLATKAGQITKGLDDSLNEIKKSRVFLIILAEDAGANTKKKVRHALEGSEIPCLSISSSEILGKYTGVKTRAVIGIKDKHFADGIMRHAEAFALTEKSNGEV